MSNTDELEFPILKCLTAKGKFQESKFFYERLKKVENQLNEFVFNSYLNAFIFSTNSVIDYVHADFIYNTIWNPPINWKNFQNREQKKIIINNHPDKLAIQKFLSKYNNELDKFLRDPIANYFRFKRNKITHVEWDGAKSGGFTINNKNKLIVKRNLESSIMYMLARNDEILDLDLFNDKIISKEVQLETFRRLCDEDMNIILKEFLEKIEQFILKFDGKNFFKKN